MQVFYSIYLSAFAAGAQRALTGEKAVIPCTFPPGIYYIGAIADSNNRVAESNKRNNSFVGNPIHISAALF
jgi:subtilase family serine protease